MACEVFVPYDGSVPPDTLPEEWRGCVGFPYYQVSSRGRVRRCVTVRGRPPNVLKPWLRAGYLTVDLQREDGQRRREYVHRLVGMAFLGLTKNHQIDHRAHDRTNNTVGAIRVATRAENMRNLRSRVHSSRYKGVSWGTRQRKWFACIHADHRTRSLGLFDDEIAAAKAYDRAALAAWGEFAFLNFPPVER